MDIVARLRQGHRVDDGNPAIGRPPGYAMLPIMDEAADTIEFLRTEVVRLEFNHGQARALEAQNNDLMTEIDRLGDSLNKCHAKLMSANCPVVDARNSEESE